MNRRETMTKIQNNEKLILKATNIRALQDDDKDTTTIQGDAIVYGQPSQPMDNFTEIVDSGALNNVDFSNTFLLLDHDYSKVIAKNGVNMTLTNDATGLHFTADLDTSISYVSDVYNLINQGIINSMSFGFTLPDDGSGEQWSEDDNGDVVRLITQIDQLFEISVVTIPAYSETDVEVATRSYEKFINNKKQNNSKEEKRNMTEKTIIKPENEETKAQKEVRSFEDYIKSHGQQRAGLTSAGAQAVIPSEVVTPVFEGANAKQNLAQMATVKQVSTGSGKYPISIPDPTKFLATKDELAAIQDVNASVKDVAFTAKTYAGKIYLSNELVDDSAIDIKQEVQSQLQQLVLNTDNHNVISLLQTLVSKKATNVDDLKKIKNTEIDPAVLGSNGSMVITNQDGYNYLDTLKDSQGRYLLTEDVTAVSGKALFGLPIVVVSNAVLPDVTSQFPVFIGNLPQTIAVFRRQNIVTNWEQFDSFSQGLAVIYRGDYEFIDKNAMQYALLGAGK